MAVPVREGIDYILLEDNYRKNFHETYKPWKVLGDGTRLYHCLYCGCTIAVGKEYNGQPPLEVDHIIPKTRLRAGIMWNPNRGWNLGPSCKSCNTRKSNYLNTMVIDGYRNKVLQKVGMFGFYSSEYSANDSEWSQYIYRVLWVILFLIDLLKPYIYYLLLSLEYIFYIYNRTIRKLYLKLKYSFWKKLFKKEIVVFPKSLSIISLTITSLVVFIISFLVLINLTRNKIFALVINLTRIK